MINAIDTTNSSAALIPQSDVIPQVRADSPTSASALNHLIQPLPYPIQPNSITETLNGLMTMLQNLLVSLRSLFSNGLGSDAVVPPTTGESNRFDFLRQVDEESPTVIPPSASNRAGTASNLGQIPLDNDAQIVVDETKKTSTAKTPKSTTKKSPKSSKPKSSTLSSPNGEFLWKPKSEKDGKLAILLPKSLTGRVKSVQVLSADGKKILGKGRSAGVGNGEREHFRFTKAGGEYPDGAIVSITLEDGSKQTVKIKESSQRMTR